MAEIDEFEEFKIGIVSPERIRAWSNGEVKKPETINYRTLKPERDGLFCEKIFGPTKDWECYCGKYKKVRFKGIICEKCGVEITRSRVRRERMGHIELAAPVAHIWYFKGIPSKMGYLLDMSPKDLEKVLYFASHIITDVDEEKRQADLDKLKEEMIKEFEGLEADSEKKVTELEKEAEKRLKTLEEKLSKLDANPKVKVKTAAKKKTKEETASAKKKAKEEAAIKKEVKEEIARVKQELEKEIKSIKAMTKHQTTRVRQLFDALEDLQPRQLVPEELFYRDLEEKYGDYFEGGIGAEAIRELLLKIILEKEAKELRAIIKTAKGQRRAKAIKRLKVVAAFRRSKNRPQDMILETIPVIPPDLRPMVQLDGGRFATSDLNDLYRRVINRNNRLKRLLDLGAPKIIVNNEKRMLQEAVDTLFDNGRRGRPITGPGNRPLKSLSDMLKGKQGRFRQNLLGKRVDYSGRSVIVIGPELKFYQCGLPKQIAIELFKPFVMKRLVDLGHAPNIKGVKRLVERAHPLVWDVLEEVIREHTVLLNRAPTLHRLGIQAFEPVLVEGKAIQIHPLVCMAFNADFDGDQMAVHLPLSAEAQAEARILMLSTNNILSPANGRPIATPTQDIVLGCFYLTIEEEEAKGKGKIFASPREAILAHQFDEVDLRALVEVHLNGERVKTTVGRLLFNETLPEDYSFINVPVGKKELADIVADCVDRYELTQTVEILDKIKSLGFHYATKAGITIGLDDIKVPKEKWEMLNQPEQAVEKIERQYRRGLITDVERHQRMIEIWTKATEDVTEAMERNFDVDNPIYMMATSGARGNLKQIRQLAGMRGLVVNPKGDIIDRPIKTNFREGMSVLEYFISTHGGRKGLADTALRTADAGYLTRRLVDVVQDVIVREEDCGTEENIRLPVIDEEGELNQSLAGRITSKNVLHPKTRKVLLGSGEEVKISNLKEFQETGVEAVSVRSVLTCEIKHGICQKCYGTSLAAGRLVDIGEAVGIIAAQSIGEPGTQLTLRTFHTGGVVGEDITHGLPRVVELFEARRPKGQAQIAEVSGKVEVAEDEKYRKVVIKSGGGRERTYIISPRARLRVSHGDLVQAGDQLTEGSINPHEILRIKGIRATQLYLVEGVQEVYKSQGVDIHDKHIELIIRQMLRKVQVVRAGDTELLPGQLINRHEFEEENVRVQAEGGEPAQARPLLLGITKAALATDSFLSAASFQETTRILTDAAVSARSDPLLGLKENVIIGKLIPAGTGMRRYRTVDVVKNEQG